MGQRRVPLLNYSGGTEVGGILTGTVIHPLKPCAFAGPILGKGADIVDTEGAAVGCGVTGELVMRAPSIGLTHGLWQDRERYLESYWSRLPDVWSAWRLCSKLTVPSETEALLMGTGLVLDAVAVGTPDPVKDTALVCVCVPRPDIGQDIAAKNLSDAVVAGLGGAFRPAKVVFVPDLPRTRSSAAWLGEEVGDLSTLADPEAVEAIRAAHC